uniref:Uncharacterized protein n=1 Tax=Leersia perrieri TaxID=77586 RepID=A0A0D9VDW9_9ORYZ
MAGKEQGWGWGWGAMISWILSITLEQKGTLGRVFPQGDGNRRNNVNPATDIQRMWTIFSHFVGHAEGNWIPNSLRHPTNSDATDGKGRNASNQMVAANTWTDKVKNCWIVMYFTTHSLPFL